MSIRGIMKTERIVTPPEMPVHTATELLIDNRITGLPVIEDAGEITAMDVIHSHATDPRFSRTSPWTSPIRREGLC